MYTSLNLSSYHSLRDGMQGTVEIKRPPFLGTPHTEQKPKINFNKNKIKNSRTITLNHITIILEMANKTIHQIRQDLKDSIIIETIIMII